MAPDSAAPAMHLLVLASLSAADKAKVEEVFESVEYATSQKLTWSAGPPPPVSSETMKKTTVIFGWQVPVDVTRHSQFPNLVWQMTPSAGADKLLKSDFWHDEDTRNKVALTTNSGVHCSVIPPYVMAMVSNLFLNLIPNFQSQGLYRGGLGHCIDSQGPTNLIHVPVGYGRLGRETARLAKAYGCNVIAATSDGRLKPDPESVQMCPGFGDADGSIPSAAYSTKNEASFAEFLSKTDVLVISLPGAPGTTRMINKDRLAKLKKRAVLVNIGRGVVVDHEALVEALESGHLGGAALDVTDPEPLPDGHKLWTTPNVIITPHIAGLTERYLSRSIDMLVTNASRLKKGQNLLNAVDLAKGY